ncbi:MAG: extracellular solute-binding protein, partial [Clostridia bacterium]|nr:extracellular solute-binding protein [Clostridia bacterium]
FNYDSDWQTKKLGSGDDTFKFYFEKGPHTLTLEVTAGDVAEIIGTVSKSINDLNRINRRIKLITGNKVDTNRDYNFKALIPEEIKEMAEIRKELQESVDYINEQAGSNGSFVSIIQKVIFQLEIMSETPRLIPKYLTRFQSNLGSLGEWLLSATEQPLKLDKIYIQPAGNEIPKADAGFFKSLWFNTKSFILSFATDYNSIGGESSGKEKETLTVWVQTGRDQAQVIRELVDESFVKQNDNVSVKIQVVASGLLQSVLAGDSPDVVTDCAETLPLEYALRNATMDLTQFDDFEEVFSRFSEASIKPAKFRNKVYGMPQTFSYLMMFYRTDIFAEYGYTLPKTWTELCEMIPAFQRNGMEVGMPHSLDAYTTFLYQNGGKLYKGDGYATNLDDYTSITSFANLTEFFTLYDCPVTYNFANRFRSGELPLAIAAYTEYNQLTAFAPEIKGMWKMVPILGTMDKDGNINNLSVGNSTFTVIMNSSKNKELAWEFLKWFMSTEVQGKYAIQMESILGTCAKVASANTEALSNMTWSSSEYTELFKQMENVDNVPQVPGSYYLSRIVTFAFNRVYNNDENPKEVIGDYIKELNDELTRKRAEFGLED